jgi:mannitol-specific phosphotransferase system IIBC component
MNKDLCMNLSVQAMPTIIGYQGGKEVSRVRGANEQMITKNTEDLAKLAK